jgi:hypothetical protein
MYTIGRCTVSPQKGVPFHPTTLENLSKKRCTVSPWISPIIHRGYPLIGVPFHPTLSQENLYRFTMVSFLNGMIFYLFWLNGN